MQRRVQKLYLSKLIGSDKLNKSKQKSDTLLTFLLLNHKNEKGLRIYRHGRDTR